MEWEGKGLKTTSPNRFLMSFLMVSPNAPFPSVAKKVSTYKDDTKTEFEDVSFLIQFHSET